LFSSGATGQEVVTVTAKGSAAVVSGNVAGAKEAALEDARRSAVEQVGSEVISETVVENFELVKDVIVTKVAGYVKNYSVVDEACSKATCKTTIEAQVSAKMIKDDASIIYKEMKKPRVMILVPETSPSGEVEIKSSVCENTVMEYFKAKGFELVDRSQALANIEADRIRAAARGDAKEAVMLGSRAGAEVIVVGTANTGAPESIRGILYAATPTVSVRAINTANASIYATSTETGKGQGGTPDQAQKTALQETAKKVGKDIFWKIVQAWNQEKLNGVPIEVVVTGVNFSRLNKLKKELSGLEEVKEVIQREFAAPAATLTVYVLGDANRLAELIHANNIAEVKAVSQGKVTIELK
jgi:hypothetical protein